MDNSLSQKTKNPKKVEDKVKTIIGKHLPMINSQYNTNLQLARFTDLKVVEDLKVMIEAGLDKDDKDDQSMVYFINGHIQPADRKLFEKFTYLFIKMLDSKIEKMQNIKRFKKDRQYTLVYFAGDEVMSSGFTKFREFMKLLPVKYYVRLKQMYVYHASLLVRSFLFFENSKRGKLWKKRTRFVGNLTELFNIYYMHKRWIELVPAHCKDGIDLTNLNTLRSESIALNPIQEAKNVLSIFGRELATYELNDLGIPEVLDHLLSYFSRDPKRLHQQGIFRKSSSVQETMQLSQLLSEGHYETLKVVEDVNIVADIIKKYFNSLATPIINFSLYDVIVKTIPILPEDSCLEFIQIIMDQMPALNRRVLSVMLSFLLQIIHFEDLNKMTAYNISVVFAPCLLWPLNHTTQEVLNIGLCIKFISLMLKHYPSIFPNISYKLFLKQPEPSTSTSSHSSAGIENQLQQFEEEQKQQQDLEPDLVQGMEDSGLEFTIDSILINVKHNKPLQLRKTESRQPSRLE